MQVGLMQSRTKRGKRAKSLAKAIFGFNVKAFLESAGVAKTIVQY